jgi:hypothetical protein
MKKALYLCTPQNTWRGVRVVEGARLESVYRSKAYRGFESRPLRQSIQKLADRLAFLFQTEQRRPFDVVVASCFP